jgi:hypothetical protein
MCLYQPINNRTDSSGRLCVKDHKFFLAQQLIGHFEGVNGVLGLSA